MDRLNRDNRQTFVLVTHAREVAAHAGRIVRMRDGEIIDDGLPIPAFARQSQD
jgi:putative ABC transport system ATP-binding protein